MKLGEVLWAIVFVMAGSIAAHPQKTTFSVTAEEVRIDVLLTDKGKPLGGMRATDFEIFDNGVPQEIRFVTLQKQTPISATLVFDMSRSVAGDLLDRLKEAADSFLADLQKEDYAALITFNNAVTLGSRPDHDFQQTKQALDRARPYGNSSLIDGSYAGLVLAESRPEPPLIIVFSDGSDTASWLTSAAVLETAKRTEAVVYAVSSNRRQNKKFLSDLTNLTGGSVFEVESNRDIASTFLNILEEFRQRYLVTYTPQGVSQGGWHKLEVRVKHRSAKIKARPGYVRSSPDQ